LLHAKVGVTDLPIAGYSIFDRLDTEMRHKGYCRGVHGLERSSIYDFGL
jgi:hypothetical protein